MAGRGWLVGVALACAALGAGGCSFEGSLEEYCAKTGDCLCEGGGCCVRAGRACGGEGGECCGTLTCSSGRCVGGQLLAIDGSPGSLVVPDVGAEARVALTVRNTGVGAATARGLRVALVGSSAFTLQSGGCEGVTLEPGARCALEVRYVSRTLAAQDVVTLEVQDLEGNAASTALSARTGEELSVALVDRRTRAVGTGPLVTSDPAGLNCPPACKARFPVDAGVRLRIAVPDAGYGVAFDGAGCDGGATCVPQLGGSGASVTATLDGWLRVRSAYPEGLQPSPSDAAGLALSDGGVLDPFCNPCGVQAVGPVTLSAWADRSLGLTGWGGACADAGVSGACTVDVRGPTEVVLNVGHLNAVFTPSRTYRPGDLGGLAGADALCAEAARQSTLAPSNTYRAYLAVQGAPPHTRLAGARGWYAPEAPSYDARPLADRPEDLATSRFVDPRGFISWASAVATGTLADGSVDTAGLCGGWTSLQGTTWPGRANAGAGGWLRALETGALACSASMSLYCFGTDHSTVPLPHRPRGY